MQKSRGLGRTDLGRARERNEDSFLIDEELGLYIVSDGMGGHAAGEVASALAVQTVARVLRDEASLIGDVAAGNERRARLNELVERAIVQASQRVFEKATEPGGPAGMGCTLTTLLVAGPVAVMGHVGDSRLYLVRGEGVSQLSADHTVAAELHRAGLMSEETMEQSPYANVLSRAIGTQAAVRVDTLALDTLPGDRFLICSDGFSNYLTVPSSLAETVQGDLEEVAGELIAMANESGGSDNITTVLVSIESEEPQTERITRVEENFEALGSLFLFEDLSMPLLSRIISACRAERHEAGDLVIEKGDRADSLFVVVDGCYELRVGGESTTRLAGGAYTGINFLLAPRPARATMIAVEPSRLLRLRANDFARVIRERPWMGIALLELLGERLSRDLDNTIQRGEAGAAARAGEHL